MNKEKRVRLESFFVVSKATSNLKIASDIYETDKNAFFFLLEWSKTSILRGVPRGMLIVGK